MEISQRFKYPSTKHLPFSPEKHRDDDYHPNIDFFEGKQVVLTEKMDGENLTVYSDGKYHARSIETPYHPSRTFAGKFAGRIAHKLPEGWRLCAENIYAKHSIKYNDLRSFVQVFSIWNQNNEALSWEKTKEWCDLLDIVHVPEIWSGEFNYENIKESFTHQKLCQKQDREVEGYVMRTLDGFSFDDFELHLTKFVRPNHVQTDEHWLQKDVEPNELDENINNPITKG